MEKQLCLVPSGAYQGAAPPVARADCTLHGMEDEPGNEGVILRTAASRIVGNIGALREGRVGRPA